MLEAIASSHNLNNFELPFQFSAATEGWSFKRKSCQVRMVEFKGLYINICQL